MATDSIKFYGLIYVALLALAASKFGFFQVFEGYWMPFILTLISAGIKTALIVAYYQHLRWENPSLTWLMALAAALFLLLMSAATYSIT